MNEGVRTTKGSCVAPRADRVKRVAILVWLSAGLLALACSSSNSGDVEQGGMTNAAGESAAGNRGTDKGGHGGAAQVRGEAGVAGEAAGGEGGRGEVGDAGSSGSSPEGGRLGTGGSSGTAGHANAGASGSGGGSVGPAPVCTAVGTQDFETTAAEGTWLVDNSSAQAGTQASHPPIMAAGATASLKYTCGGKPSTQLKFWYRGNGPTADQHLNFFVNGSLYATYGATPNGVGGYPFYQVELTLPDGQHEYRWDATTNVAGQPPFWVDSISCAESGPVTNQTGQFGFEECFVPSELPPAATNAWQIDNSSHQAGSLAAHPPALAAGSTASLSFSCGDKPHSQLSFYYQGVGPTVGQTLKFYVDNALYQTYAGTPNGVGDWPFYNVTLTVPTGMHHYRWDVTSNSGGQPPYWLDSISCANNPAAANTTDQYGFEEGFVPLEIVPAAKNPWQIDNSSHQSVGALAIHPPALTAGATSSMTFSCGGETHSKLSFYYQGIAPTAGQTLKLYVDNTLYQTYGSTPNGVGGYPFAQVSITLTSAPHTYRWDVTTDVAAQPPYWLDNIQCQSLSADIRQASLQVVDTPFGAAVLGSFDLDLALGPEASGSTSVTPSSFSLQTASGAALVDPLRATPDAPSPWVVGKGSSKVVHYTLEGNVLRSAVCPSPVRIVGAVMDSLKGGTDTAQSALLTPDCGPAT